MQQIYGDLVAFNATGRTLHHLNPNSPTALTEETRMCTHLEFCATAVRHNSTNLAELVKEVARIMQQTVLNEELSATIFSQDEIRPVVDDFAAQLAENRSMTEKDDMRMGDIMCYQVHRMQSSFSKAQASFVHVKDLPVAYKDVKVKAFSRLQEHLQEMVEAAVEFTAQADKLPFWVETNKTRLAKSLPMYPIFTTVRTREVAAHGFSFV